MKSIKIHNPKVVIITTLITFMLLMVLGSTVAIYFLSKETASLERIVESNIEQQFLYNMNRAASQRILYLHKMLNSNDSFEQDEFFILYMKQGDIFLQSSTKLKTLLETKGEYKIWNNLGSMMIKLKNIQQDVIDMVLTDSTGQKMHEAKKIFLEKAVPAQDEFLKTLAKMLNEIRNEILIEFQDSAKENKSSTYLIISISLITILLSILICFWVLRHFSDYQRVINIEKNKAIRANLKKSQFLANISHEIRTPLTAIIGFSQAIKKAHSDKIAFDQMSDKITRNGMHLLDLINNVLDLSKIEAGELSVEKINVSLFMIIDEVNVIISEQAKVKNLSFEFNLQFPLPRVIKSDPTRIKQILINLCSNAIKFTDKGSVIVNVSFDHLQQKLSFEVVDTGIGMAKSTINKIFSAFSQADMSTTRKFGGSGLGLHISKRLAVKLNGSLSCTSTAGVGSKFKLELQFSDIENDLLVYDEPTDIKAKNALCEVAIPKLQGSILLAEDIEDNRDLISMYIEDTTAELTVVENGLYAVQECLEKRKEFDLILMDMQMPMMDGFEAVSKLRERGYNKPIVMLTANALNDDIKKSISIGAEAHLAKPIDLNKFYITLSKYLKSSNC